jgi:flagellin-like protein
VTPTDGGTTRDRAQSDVVGVAILLGITVVALGALTAGIGTVVQQNAAGADAARVADGFESALRPVETTGVRRGRVAFSAGQLRVVERDLRVSNGTATRRVAVDALVYESGQRRVAFLAGAIVRGDGAGARVVREPPIVASRGTGGVLVVGAPRLDAATVGVGGRDGVETVLRTNVSHERTRLGTGRYRVAVETATPAAWRVALTEAGGRVTATRDLDGDGVESVVARFPGRRLAYLVVHEMDLEVTR